MDVISIPSVSDVSIRAGSSKQARNGSLHLTSDQLIHKAGGDECWIPYTLLHSVQRLPSNHTGTINPIVLRTRFFETFELVFRDSKQCEQVWETVKASCTAAPSRQKQRQVSTKGKERELVYELDAEFDRMGLGKRTSAWRVSDVNSDYEFCPTYPSAIVVPSKISETTLRYAVKYRSKGRIPGLVYLHWSNLGSITRSSQPMVGIKGARSIQDEKLIELVFTSHSQHSTLPQSPPRASFLRASSTTAESVGQAVFGAQSANLIIDARPTTNARANSVMGAGSENMDHYKNCEKAYLGIDNIHVMRNSLNAVFDAVREAEESESTVDIYALKKSGWLKHLTTILDGTILIVKTIHLSNSHVLVHCSDGWDRTSQLSSLAQLCLDPYYRTAKGFAVLIEKDWSSFGHKFAERSGLYCADRVSFLDRPREDQSAQSAFLASVRGQFSASSHAYKETCPVLQQWCDCVYQIMRQYPQRFEFRESWLRQIVKAVLTGQGGFACNSERERKQVGLDDQSAWDSLLPLADEHRNERYDPKLDNPEDKARENADQGVLLPEPSDVQWWPEFFNRPNDELNPVKAPVDAKEEIRFVQTAAEDPVVASALSSALPARSSSPATAFAASSASSSPPRVPSPAPSSAASGQRQQPYQSHHQNQYSNEAASQPGLALPSQAQLQSTLSSVQKFGWGAWKQVTKGYQEAVSQYKEYSTTTNNASGMQGSPERPRSRPRTPVTSGAAGRPADQGRSVPRTGIVEDINAFNKATPTQSSSPSPDKQKRQQNDIVLSDEAGWDAVKTSLPSLNDPPPSTTNGTNTETNDEQQKDPLGVL